MQDPPGKLDSQPSTETNGQGAPSSLYVYILVIWFSGPGESHSWDIKLTSGIFKFLKDLHTFQRERKRTYAYIFLK